MATITMRRNGAVRAIPTGFSWTTLLFGCLPSFFRLQWAMGWLYLLLDFIALLISAFIFEFSDLLLCILAVRIYNSFIRNEKLAKNLRLDGWQSGRYETEFSRHIAANDTGD